jgi:glutamate 5-kinase
MSKEIRAVWPFDEKHPLRRVVVKVGSNVLALKSGGIDPERLAALCAQIAAVRSLGIEVVLVTSGAVAAGRGLLGLDKRPTELPELQAVAAIGQCALMEAYSRAFRNHGLIAAQLLLNREDMDDRRRYLNARLALTELVRRNAIPVINENDTVNIEELKFGDNDMLSAMIAGKMDADLLVLLTNVPGLMTGHPKHDPTARLIPVVAEVTAEIEGLVASVQSEHGTGGMRTKLMAARHANTFGVACVVADGTAPNILPTIVAGDFKGTYFAPRAARKSGSSRRHWIHTTRPRGTVVVDAGAARALTQQHKSLLPVGITAVEGNFHKGDTVRIIGPDGTDLAHGITNYDADKLNQLKGMKRPEWEAAGIGADYTEAIHCDNIALLQ